MSTSTKKIPKLTGTVQKLIGAAPKRAFPKKIKPMLATLVNEAFDKPGWSFEIKWDGYRALSLLRNGKVELKSRNDKSFNDKFYPIYEVLQQWDINVVLDGEIVVLDENGLSNFQRLQSWRSEADGELFYYIFDILWLDGHDLTGLTLSQRRKILKSLIQGNDIIRVSETFDASGTAFFESARKLGLEGIIAKKDNSMYVPATRSNEWLKIKSNRRQEVVIGGYTNNEGSDKLFSALLVGVFENGKLQYTGKIGTGFNKKLQEEMIKQFKTLIVKKSPFSQIPDINKPSRFRPNPPKATAVWLKPELVCEVSYAEMTSDGVMRHPSFEGMRIDKNANTVVQEIEKPSDKLTKEHKELSSKKLITRPKGKSRKTLLNPTEQTQVRKINDRELKFNNLNKIFWPKEKITKRDMLNYYYQVVPYILPYLVGRPQSMNRFPNGVEGKSFYQKDVKGKVPDWIDTFPYYSEADGREKEFLVCNDEAALLYMASLGCIEINPWSSTVDTPDTPDWCIIDLDPDKNSFNQVIEAAQITHELLDSIGVASYCKTSGSTGLHIYIPLGKKYSYEDSKEFGRAIVKKVHAQIPKFTSIERLTSKRNGKMYLDFLQNRPQATLAAPYSLRPKPGATVSMPLYWEEVRKGLTMKDFTILNAIDRLKDTGDLFKPVLGKGINLKAAIKKLNNL
jgi:bifunctional non-homologous end joining protein LigD